MGGISADRAYRIQETLRYRISDAYGTARHFHETHETLLKRLKSTVWDTPELKKCPARVHAYLMGHARALSDEVYRRDLEWRLALDGKLVTREEVDSCTEEEARTFATKVPGYKSPWSRIDSNHSAHVWRGTLLPYDAEKRVYWAEKEKKSAANE